MNPADPVRSELAVAAARLIAEEGCDYRQAKQRALHEVLGAGADARGVLPDNAEIELELRRHLALYAADTHPALLAALRRTAASVMTQLESFRPHLVGAILNGTATEHSDVELHLFTDSAKDVELHLLNAGIDFDVLDADAAARPAPQEVLGFIVPAREPGLPRTLRRIGVRLQVFDRDAIRTAARLRTSGDGPFPLHPVAAAGRADLSAVRRLLTDAA
jgi:hypothetical protein